ncbi:MAG: hypothetical protein AAGC55_21805, partial [Myxococcota bacterium]
MIPLCVGVSLGVPAIGSIHAQSSPRGTSRAAAAIVQLEVRPARPELRFVLADGRTYATVKVDPRVQQLSAGIYHGGKDSDDRFYIDINGEKQFYRFVNEPNPSNAAERAVRRARGHFRVIV